MALGIEMAKGQNKNKDEKNEKILFSYSGKEGEKKGGVKEKSHDCVKFIPSVYSRYIIYNW